jgi:two-component system, NarL family, response regulator NreC
MMTLNDCATHEPAEQLNNHCRVLLINEHRILREAVRLIVDAIDGFDVVGDADSATQALPLIDVLRPDLIVTGLPLPDRSGVTFIGELLVTSPRAAILVLSTVSDVEHVTAAMKAGALGYVQNDAGRAELLNALRNVAAGRRYPAKSFSTSRRRTRERPQTRDGCSAELTDRQREVLRLVALGYRNKDIAFRLGVSEKAVQHQRARVSDLLDLHGTAELTSYAVRTGLVTDSLSSQSS